MTKIDQIKIIDHKIKANRAQYILDRKNAEISAKSSGELDKYEYLTGEDLGYKPDSVEKAKFEYSPLGKVFTAGLNKEDKNEGVLKRLKNIEDKNKKQLITVKDKSIETQDETQDETHASSFKNDCTKSLAQEGLDIFKDIAKQNSNINYKELYFIGVIKKNTTLKIF